MIGVDTEEDVKYIEQYIASKSNSAASVLIRKYRQFIYAVVYRYVGNYDDAQDISQEVFIKALDNLHKFKKNSSLKSWLYRIATNTAISYQRKAKIKNLFVRSDSDEFDKLSDNGGEDSMKQLDHNAFEKDLDAALLKLPKKQRETFALRYFENIPYKEIAEMLDTSVGGLKANYFQAVKKLAVHLEKYNPNIEEDEDD